MITPQNDYYNKSKVEFIEKYGSVLVKFISYYKYSFTFSGELADGGFVFVKVGGDPNDIYKMSVNADAEQTVSSLDIYSGTAYDQSGVEVESFYDR